MNKKKNEWSESEFSELTKFTDLESSDKKVPGSFFKLVFFNKI